MAAPDHPQPMPGPESDWITQRSLAELLGISETTASFWARDGRLRQFEHNFPACGRRRYSRALVERERKRCWEKAIRVQDRLVSIGET
jgi:hypothetical protein